MNIKKILIRSLLVLAIVSCFGFVYAYIEARSIKLKEITMDSMDIPDAFDGKKILFVSDIHCNSHFTINDLTELVERINSREPDIVVLGGDYTLTASAYSALFFEEIGKLNSKYGVYSVLGNHDHWSNAKLIQEGLVNCGFNICDNQSYWIKEGNDSIKIGGVGDLWEDDQLVENTIGDIDPDDFCILVSHNPDYMEVLSTDRVDLMLSGHTHGGQITFFGLYAPIMPSTFHPQYPQTGQKYRYGQVEEKGIKLYVTSGIGMGGFPLRFFARPEIVEIILRKR